MSFKKKVSKTTLNFLARPEARQTDLESVFLQCESWLKNIKTYLDSNPENVVYFQYTEDRILRKPTLFRVEVRTADARWPLREFRQRVVTSEDESAKTQKELIDLYARRKENLAEIETSYVGLLAPRNVLSWLSFLWPAHWNESMEALDEGTPYSAGIWFANPHIKIEDDELLPPPFVRLYKASPEQNKEFLAQRLLTEKQFAIKIDPIPSSFFEFLEQQVKRQGGLKPYSFLTQTLGRAFSVDFALTLLANKQKLPKEYQEVINHDVGRMLTFSKRLGRCYKPFEFFKSFTNSQWEDFLIQHTELSLGLLNLYQRLRHGLPPIDEIEGFAFTVLPPFERLVIKENFMFEVDDIANIAL